MNQSSPEDYIPSFRRRKLDEPGLLRKIARYAVRLGAPAIIHFALVGVAGER